MADVMDKLKKIEIDQAEIRKKLSNLEERVHVYESKACLGNSLKNININADTPQPQAKKDKAQVQATTTAAAATNGEAPVQKTEKQLEKDRKKAEKDAKFKEKQEKLAAEAAAAKESNKGKKAEDKNEKDKAPKQSAEYTIKTPAGDKKDTKCPLPDAYSPLYVEACWYEWWEKMGFFKPECAEKYFKNPTEKFVIVMPPPNVTGTLHLGHALMCSVEDTLTRWHRMSGRITLYSPGVDHAGIATQVVVEKKLKREQNKTRHDIGREAFVKEIWKWKEEKGDTIIHQLKKMGTSCDWDRARFTMDDICAKAVEEAFIRMHEKGLIYRSKRLVNWSCQLNSAISDIEVDKTPVKGRTFLSVPGYTDKIEFGTLTSFAYKIQNSNERIVVATTRPETMLGDTGIAVHPNDARYKHLVGKYAVHPFIKDRLLLIVADEMVDINFGTGAVKITPAHDANDFECGLRHNLKFITCIDDKGLINQEGGRFAGMKRFDARKAVIEALKKENLYVDVKDTEMVLPICSRSKDIIEPLLKSQWYVNCKEMAARAVKAVRTKKLQIIPDMHEQVWYRWLEDCHDWCISRQLWWGHRIPAYHAVIQGDSASNDDTNNEYWFSARSIDEAMEKATKKFKVPKEKVTLKHDEDVLDTWFSSGLFPFSIFGWPNQTSDLEKFYPGTILETGHDILFFWVARMVMMGEELTGKLPFEKVVLHAIIRDAHGRKMSKSLGNIIDPLDVISGTTLENLNKQLESYNLDPKEVEKAIKGQKEDFPSGIPECGTDALRFALMAYTSQGRDINLDVLRVQGYRHFCNKLWNATKFAMINGLGDAFVPQREMNFSANNELSKHLSNMDKWILSRLYDAVSQCEIGFKNYEFTTATTACYNFWLYDLCDYYIEYLKPNFYSKNVDENKQKCSREVLYTCLDTALRLISPFMPFISEELYQRLPRRAPDTDAPSIIVTQYPLPEHFKDYKNEAIENDFNTARDAILKIRSLRADYQLTNKVKTELFIQTIDQAIEGSLQNFKDLITIMTNSSNISFIKEATQEMLHGCAFTTLSDKCKLYILLKGIIDVDKELQKMVGKKEKLNQQINSLKKDMSKDDYETKVPEDVRQKNQEKLTQLTNEISLIDEGIKQLQAMK